MLKSLYEIENFELFLSSWDVYKEQEILADLVALDEECYTIESSADILTIACPNLYAVVKIQFDDYGYVMAVGVSQ